MADTGLGQCGYARYEKETVFNTPVVSSMTVLPIKEDSTLIGYSEMIENANIVASRLKQDPDLGRVVCPPATMIMDWYPDLVGGLLNILFGTSSDTDNLDGSYAHYWLQSIDCSVQRIAKSMTMQQAVGGDLSDQFTGVKIHSLVLDADTQGNLQVTFNVQPKEYTEDVARITTFVLPATIPFNWSFAGVTVTPSGDSAIDVDVNTMSITIDYSYDTERYKFGEASIKNSVFNTLPVVTASFNIDAQKIFVTHARAHKLFELDVVFTSTEDAGSSTKYSLTLELPGCRLNADTSIPQGNDRRFMDLEFDCTYGGTTTNSGADEVMFEANIVDAVAAYA